MMDTPPPTIIQLAELEARDAAIRKLDAAIREWHDDVMKYADYDDAMKVIK